MVLIAGKVPGLSVGGIIREGRVINTCVFTAFPRLLIARDAFELFGRGLGEVFRCRLDVGLVAVGELGRLASLLLHAGTGVRSAVTESENLSGWK